MPETIKRSAVVVLHAQRDIVGAEGAFAPFFAEQVATRQVVPRIAELLATVRSAGIPVVYARACWPAGHPGLRASNALLGAVLQTQALVDGTAGAEIVDELAPRPEDRVVSHQTMSPFLGGDLEQVLHELGVETVLLAGVATNVIVEEVARGAINRGFDAVVVEDCCSAATQAAHLASVETLSLLATEVTDCRSLLDRVGALAGERS